MMAVKAVDEDDSDKDDDDEVLCSPTERATSPPVAIPLPSGKERPSRKDRASLSRLSSTGSRKGRRSTATDDENDAPTFVDRCVTKMKTLINK